MRAKEFINEGGTGSIQTAVADAIPSLYVMPGLRNSDPYEQYRYGVALASAKALQAGDVSFDAESVFGDKMVIATRSKEEDEIIALALGMVGQSGSSKLITSKYSTEAPDVNTRSPSAPQYQPKRPNR